MSLDESSGVDSDAGAGPSPARSAGVARRSFGESLRASLAAATLLAFAFSATRMALGFGPEARILPLTVGIPLTIMATLNMILVVRTELIAHGRIVPRVPPQEKRGASSDADTDPDDPEAVLRAAAEGGLEEATDEGATFLGAMLSVIVVAAMFFMIGLVPTAVIYTIGYMTLIGKERLTKSVIVAALLVFMFWAFRNYLNVRFYRGWLVTEGYIPYLLPF